MTGLSLDAVVRAYERAAREDGLADDETAMAFMRSLHAELQAAADPRHATLETPGAVWEVRVSEDPA